MLPWPLPCSWWAGGLKKEGLDSDAVYSVATWAIIGGIIGTRLVHVIDLWDEVYRHDPIQIIKIWEGGITIWGGILGGFLGGAVYMQVRNHPRFLRLWNRFGGKLDKAPLPSIGRLADITAPALLIAMALGRVGDIINGEHVANLTNLPWAFIYSHPESPSNAIHGLASSHPAVVYEMLWDIAVLALIWPLRNRFRPYGMLFALYLAMYSMGKFFISFLRLDKEWAIGLNEAQFIAIIVLAIYGAPDAVEGPACPDNPPGPRAEHQGPQRPVTGPPFLHVLTVVPVERILLFTGMYFILRV